MERCAHLLALSVQRRSGLIQQQQFGVAEDGSGYGYSLLLTTWQLCPLITCLRVIFLLMEKTNTNKTMRGHSCVTIDGQNYTKYGSNHSSQLTNFLKSILWGLIIIIIIIATFPAKLIKCWQEIIFTCTITHSSSAGLLHDYHSHLLTHKA